MQCDEKQNYIKIFLCSRPNAPISVTGNDQEGNFGEQKKLEFEENTHI